MAEPRRIAAERRGRLAETRAVWLLRLKGYAILAKRFRPAKSYGLGEIDIVARRGGTLAFIEVKARPDLDSGLFAIAPAQQQRLARSAQHFVKVRPAYREWPMRFDAIILQPGRFWPKHVEDAWRP